MGKNLNYLPLLQTQSNVVQLCNPVRTLQHYQNHAPTEYGKRVKIVILNGYHFVFLYVIGQTQYMKSRDSMDAIEYVQNAHNLQSDPELKPIALLGKTLRQEILWFHFIAFKSVDKG